jgi:hypothetical protein
MTKNYFEQVEASIKYAKEESARRKSAVKTTTAEIISCSVGTSRKLDPVTRAWVQFVPRQR